MPITLETEFSEKHEETWKNEVAAQMNCLLGRALYFKQTSNDASDVEAATATLALVTRVAVFEEIETKSR
jgi:hypothetical protein